jgi:hypothetical protein
MKTALITILMLGALAVSAQTPAPQPSTPAACTTQEAPDLHMASRIHKPFGLLTVDAQDKPILIRKPDNKTPLPALVTSTPCLSKRGNWVYLLTPDQAPRLAALQ